MKLATVNPQLDFEIEELLSKDVSKTGLCVYTLWRFADLLLDAGMYECGHVKCFHKHGCVNGCPLWGCCVYIQTLRKPYLCASFVHV